MHTLRTEVGQTQWLNYFCLQYCMLSLHSIARQNQLNGFNFGEEKCILGSFKYSNRYKLRPGEYILSEMLMKIIY